MPNNFLIIVTGGPGTGKSTFSETLSTHISVPLINRDEYKEVLFDSLGYSDR
jgi:dephospho-CoA kinase